MQEEREVFQSSSKQTKCASLSDEVKSEDCDYEEVKSSSIPGKEDQPIDKLEGPPDAMSDAATTPAGGGAVSDGAVAGGTFAEGAPSGRGSRTSGTTASVASGGAPTTTISTIAVQSGGTKVVLALLQVGPIRGRDRITPP